jgi:hypothetical protein
MMWEKVSEHISQVTGEKFQASDTLPVGGGCINQVYHLTDGSRNYFVKLNQSIDSFILLIMFLPDNLFDHVHFEKYTVNESHDS